MIRWLLRFWVKDEMRVLKVEGKSECEGYSVKLLRF